MPTINFSDFGIGIAKKVDRVFTLFFTTKANCARPGLSISHKTTSARQEGFHVQDKTKR